MNQNFPGPSSCPYFLAIFPSDGHDKLSPWGIYIHGAIDGASRYCVWLHLGRSNKNPRIVLGLYLDAVTEVGLPMFIRTDLGTENGLVAAAHEYLRGGQRADVYHRYVLSVDNQRCANFISPRMCGMFAEFVWCLVFTECAYPSSQNLFRC